MKLSELKAKAVELMHKPSFPKLLVAAGALAVLIILLSDFSADASVENTAVTPDFAFSEGYSAQTEEKLSAVLSSIEGVGKSRVMITVASTEEYVYAEEIKSSSSAAENSYVIFDKGGGKDALVKKINKPCISGIVIVCEGGDDPKICEKIYRAAATALNIPTNRIYVAEMK